MLIVWMLLAVLILFIAYVLIRAALFVPPVAGETVPRQPEPLDEQLLAKHLQAMLQMKTVSYAEEGLADQAEFDRFQALLKELYPHVFARFVLERLGKNGLLLRLKGHSAENPSVLMAHYDVVPADAEGWTRPPFSGEIVDGEVWGRGALDTKCTVLGIMEAAEALAKQDFVPQNDVYISLGGDEECLGGDASAIVDALQKRGVRPAFVLDEGGAVVNKVFPGVSKPAALIGIAEKGSVFVDLVAKGRGGHASAPPARQSVGTLARALQRIIRRPMAFTLTKPAQELFDTLGRHSSFGYKLIFANLPIFWPLLDKICQASGGELNALVRTTAAMTRLSASDAYNVLPLDVKAGINLRLVPGDSIQQAAERLKQVVNDTDVGVHVKSGSEPSLVSPTQGEAWQRLKGAIQATYPEAIVSPYLMVAASDSRHYCRISEHVYRFSGLPLSKEQLAMIHARDERIPVKLLADMQRFYTRVMEQC